MTPKLALRAVLRKNALLKRRAWKTTVCEIAAPPLFLSLLTIAYLMSKDDGIDAGIYASTTIELDDLLGLSSGGLGTDGCTAGNGSQCDVDLLGIYNNVNAILSGPTPVIGLDSFLGFGLGVKERLSADNSKRVTKLFRYTHKARSHQPRTATPTVSSPAVSRPTMLWPNYLKPSRLSRTTLSHCTCNTVWQHSLAGRPPPVLHLSQWRCRSLVRAHA